MNTELLAFYEWIEAFNGTEQREPYPAEIWLARAALAPPVAQQAAPEQATIPEGWQLVPIEPTEKMIRAATECAYEHEGHSKLVTVLKADWHAMLAAAPSPQQRDESKDAVNARRYEWLRNTGQIVASSNGKGIALPMYSPGDSRGRELDAAIDAAIAQERTS